MIPVAAYCRVSTDQDDQANSFLAQQRYFRELIDRNPDWQLHEIYADEGITGTSTKKRTQFNRMMNDAFTGRFRLILTKEVSRFSRNILDTIAYTRELRSMGVGVLFVNDRIHTMEPESEMLLSFLASLAQEESRRTSSRVVWGQTRQMEQGVVFGHSLLGYDLVGGVLSVNPEGAETVRLIFHKYAVEQTGTSEIARFLTAGGYRTAAGRTDWTANAVIKILKNEKYVGDLVQKKTYTPDYLTHAKRTNKGAVPLVIRKDHHAPIVPRALWELAQDRLRSNNKHSGADFGHSNRYIFSGKILCGECGCRFVGRTKYRKDGTKIRRWSCGTAARMGAAACGVGKLVRDDDAVQMLHTAIRSLPLDRSSVLAAVIDAAMDAVLQDEQNSSGNLRRLQTEQDRLLRKKDRMMDSYFSGEITAEDLHRLTRTYDTQLEALRRKQDAAVLQQNACRDPESLRTSMETLLSQILCGDRVSEVFLKTVPESLTVFKDRHLELRLKHWPQVFRFLG